MMESTAERMGAAVWVRMARCYGLILRRVRAILASSELTLPQFDALAQLLRYPEGMTAGALSRELLVTAGNVTGIITRLEARSLITQSPKPGDRRVKVLKLTPAGRALAEREVVRLEECLEEIFAPLAFDEKSALQELLNQLRDTLKGDEADDALTHELSLRA